MFYQHLEEGGGETEESEDNSYADTLNQILLPVVLIFAYITVIFTADIFKTHNRIREMMGEWDQSKIAQIVLELQKQEIIKAFEEVREEEKAYLGLSILESGNFRFLLPLRPNGEIQSVGIEKLESGKYAAIDLGIYTGRITAKLGSRQSKDAEAAILYCRVLDKAKLKDIGGDRCRSDTGRTTIQPRNADFLERDLIAPYLDDSENVIADFQMQLLEEISLHFNRQLSQWSQWDLASYRLFQSALEASQAGRVDLAKALFSRVQKAMYEKLRKELEPHYPIFSYTWSKLGLQAKI